MVDCSAFPIARQDGSGMPPIVCETTLVVLTDLVSQITGNPSFEPQIFPTIKAIEGIWQLFWPGGGLPRVKLWTGFIPQSPPAASLERWYVDGHPGTYLSGRENKEAEEVAKDEELSTYLPHLYVLCYQHHHDGIFVYYASGRERLVMQAARTWSVSDMRAGK